MEVGGALLTINRAFRIGSLTLGSSGEAALIAAGDSIVIIPHGDSAGVSLRTPVASYKAGMLYGLAFEKPVPGGEYVGNVLNISGPGLEVSIASPGGARVSLGPGRLEVHSRGVFAIVGGGVEMGVKALMELLYSYRLLERAPASIGNFYSVKSFAYLTRVDGQVVELKAAAVGGIGSGTVYLNPPFKSKLVQVETLLGATEMPGGPRISLPVAECGCMKAKIYAGGGLLLRMIEKKGRNTG